MEPTPIALIPSDPTAVDVKMVIRRSVTLVKVGIPIGILIIFSAAFLQNN